MIYEEFEDVLDELIFHLEHAKPAKLYKIAQLISAYFSTRDLIEIDGRVKWVDQPIIATMPREDGQRVTVKRPQ